MDLNAIKMQIEALDPLVERLMQCKRPREKLKILHAFPSTLAESRTFSSSAPLFERFSEHFQVVIYSLFAIRQGAQVLQSKDALKNDPIALERLLERLDIVERFYENLGGIVGYHLTFLKLLVEIETPTSSLHQKFEKPLGLDISEDAPAVIKATRKGIEALPSIAEIYPVAGAADRLNLCHEETGEPLPAAKLHFLGITLLETLIRDLEAREYLYFKLTNKRLTTPIVLMTSFEKNNHQYILSNLESCNWFGRPREKFFFIVQPLVPVICKDGLWATKGPLELVFKPGGHGVIWKLAKEQGAFKWLRNLKRAQALIRQINNPIGGIDKTLLALSGVGCSERKAFGFVSCERIVQSAEGMNVLVESKMGKQYTYKVSNVEYTDFKRRGIEDAPEKKGSPFSRFPANTNILFANLSAVEKAVADHPIPGLLINMKSAITCLSSQGKNRTVEAGRVESTMQNIADYIIHRSSRRLSKEEKQKLPTFLVYNKRHKTIAVTKKSYRPGESIRETSKGALFEILHNAHELLTLCGFVLPPFRDEKAFIASGPSYLFTYHPALGPLYEVIRQKLQGGKLHLGAEIKLDIAELFIEHLEVRGSLVIYADQVTGHANPQGKTLYSHRTGKCFLKNVVVKNKGISHLADQDYSNHVSDRKEALFIHLQGMSEFFAENVVFEGAHELTIPNGYRMIAEQNGKSVKFHLEKLHSPSWYWSYRFQKNNRIKIERATPFSSF